jgi:uncharacterized protein
MEEVVYLDPEFADTEPAETPVAAAEPQNAPSSATTALEPITLEQARVLGCLIEKEATTPDYYPLTQNSLVTACNQSTNRDPVVSYDDRTVEAALDGLKARNLVFQVTLAGARVQKFKHNFLGKFPALDRPQVALLCVLLLRGAQTVGELRQRAERLYSFPDLTSTEETLTSLIQFQEGPLVVKFPPGPGRKATLYAHTFCGQPEAPSDGSGSLVLSVAPSIMPQREDQEWKAKIEAELAELRAEVQRLKQALGES